MIEKGSRNWFCIETFYRKKYELTALPKLVWCIYITFVFLALLGAWYIYNVCWLRVKGIVLYYWCSLRSIKYCFVIYYSGLKFPHRAVVLLVLESDGAFFLIYIYIYMHIYNSLSMLHYTCNTTCYDFTLYFCHFLRHLVPFI